MYITRVHLHLFNSVLLKYFLIPLEKEKTRTKMNGKEQQWKWQHSRNKSHGMIKKPSLLGDEIGTEDGVLSHICHCE